MINDNATTIARNHIMTLNIIWENNDKNDVWFVPALSFEELSSAIFFRATY
jgi:hypothetical protein